MSRDGGPAASPAHVSLDRPNVADPHRVRATAAYVDLRGVQVVDVLMRSRAGDRCRAATNVPFMSSSLGTRFVSA
jgi:hypothetical protein